MKNLLKRIESLEKKQEKVDQLQNRVENNEVKEE